MDAHTETDPQTGVVTEFVRLVAAADARVDGAVEQLRDFFNQRPDIAPQTGNLSRLAQQNGLDYLSKHSVARSEAVALHIESHRQDLAPTTMLEELLIDQMLAGWLEFNLAEVQQFTKDTGGFAPEELVDRPAEMPLPVNKWTMVNDIDRQQIAGIGHSVRFITVHENGRDPIKPLSIKS
jgi:hypothetical protein